MFGNADIITGEASVALDPVLQLVKLFAAAAAAAEAAENLYLKLLTRRTSVTRFTQAAVGILGVVSMCMRLCTLLAHFWLCELLDHTESSYAVDWVLGTQQNMPRSICSNTLSLREAFCPAVCPVL